ncbi:SDR family oxidoreductase [Phanerochaete sordida]|uniref:SDR family oxidoreductase n=1 Tax=Phanerochaete sordida TaxID=48140 RepID=A0A9P3GJ47_9APHY|nr:SDR family oxidoreductase [Phanerochaete sordida]
MAAPTTTWLITGSSRGIGLETTRQLLQAPSNVVIATCRSPSTAVELQALSEGAKGKLHILPLDTADMSSIDAVLKPVDEILGEGGLDYLLNNAAINVGMDTGFSFSPDDLLRTINVNVAGPGHLAQTLLPLLERGRKKTIMNMTSGLASIALDCGPKCATYSISKTAVNMLTYKQSKARPDFTVICLDPGWVKTEMGGEGAVLEPHESVSSILKVLGSLTLEDSGKFFNRDKGVIPW